MVVDYLKKMATCVFLLIAGGVVLGTVVRDGLLVFFFLWRTVANCGGLLLVMGSAYQSEKSTVRCGQPVCYGCVQVLAYPRDVSKNVSYITVHFPHPFVGWSASRPEYLVEHLDDLLNAVLLCLERSAFHSPGLVSSIVAESLFIRSLVFEECIHVGFLRCCDLFESLHCDVSDVPDLFPSGLSRVLYDYLFAFVEYLVRPV